MTISARRAVTTLLLSSAVIYAGDVQAQEGAASAAAPAFAPADKLPFDSRRHDRNASERAAYYIRRNGRPEQRVAMQLAVKAGSIDEENDQQGLAHFLEHMAFNGTRHFKAG